MYDKLEEIALLNSLQMPRTH